MLLLIPEPNNKLYQVQRKAYLRALRYPPVQLKNISKFKAKEAAEDLEGGYSAFTNRFASNFITWGSVVYSMSSMGSRCGSKGPCALM